MKCRMGITGGHCDVTRREARLYLIAPVANNLVLGRGAAPPLPNRNAPQSDDFP